MTAVPRRVVAADANVLINLIHVARLDLCGVIPGHEFVVPDHVREEITDAAQRAALEDAIARDALDVVSITDIHTIELYAELTVCLGRGESACLALAVERGWTVASDEKGRFRREAVARIGEARLVGTVYIFVLAIRAGLITIEEADIDKATLDAHRFSMPFGSFREVLST